MSDRILYIGDKNYSSWSLRAWLPARRCGPFAEQMIWLDRPETAAQLAEASPNAKVPALRDGDLVIWESLAIGEYLAEKHPEAQLWPDAPDARAVSRSVANEMHAGFGPLRSHYPMDLRARIDRPPTPAVRDDIDRVCTLWRDCRSRFGADGPFLFGRWSIADAMYAPVATRFVTYGVELDPVCAAYRDALLADPDMQQWTRDGIAEPVRS
jgi:glutathione S-transferase